MESESFFRSYQVLGHPYITRNSLNLKVHRRVHNSTQPVLILSRINPVQVYQTSTSRPILILFLHPFLHPHLGLTSFHLPSGFTTKTLYAAPLSPLPTVAHEQPAWWKTRRNSSYYLPGPGSRCETQTYRIGSMVTFEIWWLWQSTLNARFSFRLPKPREVIALWDHTLWDQW